MFASLCLYPDFYAQHMQKFIAIAPVMFVQNLNSTFIQKYHKDEWIIKAIKNTMGDEVFTFSGASNFLTKVLQATKPFKKVGDSFTEQVSDKNSKLIDEVGNKNFLRFFPSGTSLRCLLHFKQMMIEGKFRRYDFGAVKNMERYNGS